MNDEKEIAKRQYEGHWFVKSLKYKKPSLPRLPKQKKSDKKQLSLFDLSKDGTDA